MGTVSIADVRVTSVHRPVDMVKVRELAESIRQVGLLHPITVTPDNGLVAGQHRLEGCRLLGWTEIPAVVIDLDGPDVELARIDENLRRNDLTVLERGEHLARRCEILEAKGQRAKVGQGRPAKNGDTVTPFSPTTTAALANDAGVSERTAQRCMQIARAVVPEARELIRHTPIADSTKDLLCLSRLPAERQPAVALLVQEGTCRDVAEADKVVRYERLRADAAAYAAQADPGDDQSILVDDMSVLYERLADESADLFLCDPPWGQGRDREVYSQLARLAAAKLKPGHLCMAYAPVGHLLQAMIGLNEHLTYWVTFGILLGGQRRLHRSLGLVRRWRPVLVFCRPPVRRARRWVADFVKGSGPDKTYHAWGQNPEDLRYWLEQLTDPGDLIVDPFCGGGAVPVIASVWAAVGWRPKLTRPRRRLPASGWQRRTMPTPGEIGPFAHDPADLRAAKWKPSRCGSGLDDMRMIL